jgi:hypothetical protein
MRPALKALALAAADGGWVFVAVIPRSRRVVLEQPVAPRVGARPVEHHQPRPAPPHRGPVVSVDVWVLAHAEHQPLHADGLGAARLGGAGLLARIVSA